MDDHRKGRMSITKSIAVRRHWFEDNLVRVSPDMKSGKKNVLFTCPCCGYPTLSERCIYEICCLCNWEDDGQDDSNADEVRGGPNKGYSLTQARINFAKLQVMYSPDDDPRIGGEDSVIEKTAKRAITEAFDAMRTAMNRSEYDPLWQLVTNNRRVLENELDRRIRDYEERMKSSD